MTPLEELQAAHNRLSELRDSTRTKNVQYKGGSTARGVHIVSDSHSVSVSPYFELQRTLHRTIDAQLSMLENVIAEFVLPGARWGAGDEPGAAKQVLSLARAINGEAS